MKKARFNVLDAVIIAVVIAVAALGYFYLRSGGFSGGDPVTVYYTVELEGLPKGFHELVSAETTVKDSIKGYYLGIIDSIDVRKSEMWRLNQRERKYELFPLEDEEVLHVTVRANGYETEEKVVAEDNEVRIGKTMYLEGKGFVLSGYIVEIRTEKGAGK